MPIKTTYYYLQLEELKSLEIENKDLKQVIKTYESTLIKLESIENQYNVSDIEEKRKLIGSIFPKKFQFENKKVRTADINPLFLKISSINSASQRIKKRQIQKKLNLSGMVGDCLFRSIGKGFEPPTLPIASGCSKLSGITLYFL